MVSKATKIRLGIFLAVGSLLIIVFAAAVAGSKLVQKRDIYFIQFKNYSVSGIQVGGAVNYQGIKVGRVESIKIDPKDVTKITLTISVESGTPIKADTEALLTLAGITGLKNVEIRGGTNESALLKPKSFIKVGTSMIDDISDRAVSIAEKIELIAANISDLTNAENRQNIATILEQTSLLISSTQENLSTTLASFNKIASNTANVTENLGKNLDILTINLTKNVDAITSSTTNNIDNLTNDTRASLETLTKTLNAELTSITANLEQSLNQITTQSTSLMEETQFQINSIGGNTDKMILETTKQIVTTSDNINRSLEKVNAMLSTPGVDSLMYNVGKLAGKLAQTDLNAMVTELSVTIQKTGTLITTLNRLVVRGQGDLLDILDSMAETSDNLKEFTRQISDTPSILLRGN
ncbi:MAG: MlaD family protein [Candidatus Cloacimonetes bacterium]|nr:MlaD family protein [Candidatus Cloacimonadota bacterium]